MDGDATKLGVDVGGLNCDNVGRRKNGVVGKWVENDKILNNKLLIAIIM